MWNFKGTLWNSTQNILPIHWKIWLLYNIEILRALRFKSSYALLKRPLVAQRRHGGGRRKAEASPETKLTTERIYYVANIVRLRQPGQCVCLRDPSASFERPLSNQPPRWPLWDCFEHVQNFMATMAISEHPVYHFSTSKVTDHSACVEPLTWSTLWSHEGGTKTADSVDRGIKMIFLHGFWLAANQNQCEKITVLVTLIHTAVRKGWRATACCEKKMKFAISSAWLEKGSVSHPDDIITLPQLIRVRYQSQLSHPDDTRWKGM